MESRLPQPRINLVKAKSTLSTVTGSSQHSKPNNFSSQITSNTTSTTRMGDNNIKNAFKTTSFNVKNGSENNPPKETGVTRSKTMSTILRQRPTQPKQAVKRLGNAINAIEVKRQNISQRPIKPPTSGAATTNNTNPSVKTTAKPVTKPTVKAVNKAPAKWDLKGRLAFTTDELSTIKSKNKEMSSKFSEMEETVRSLQEGENIMKVKVEELECSNAKLNEDLSQANAERQKYLHENEHLKNKLETLEALHVAVSESLKEYKERCNKQEKILNEQKVRLDECEEKLKTEQEKNSKLTSTTEDLQILVHSMDKERRVLHNTMQEMKGNIRVFCRVRPTIPKEASKGYNNKCDCKYYFLLNPSSLLIIYFDLQIMPY